MPSVVFRVGPSSAIGMRITPAVPVNVTPPVVTGPDVVGQTLTSTTGVFTNTPTHYDYQWQSGGVNVGTNQNTYVPVSGDAGNTITCTVTPTNGQGQGLPATSAAVGPVIVSVVPSVLLTLGAI